MRVATVLELLAVLRQLRLLEAKQLEELARKFQAKSVDTRALAQTLLEQGWLTPYQVNQLLQGRGQDLVLGSYILLERLGEGGMGEVFKARHQKMGRVVALKLIRKERLTHPAAVKRFQREIRSAAQLSHPNVVHALDADQVGTTQLFVMEYVAGVDLSKLVKQQGPLPVAQACDCIRQAALGLQHAYEKGMVHRDIKPHNLLLANDGVVKVLDFGLARMAGAEDSGTLTQEGSTMGTLDYVAPEQARDSHAVDIRTDLYSLGCTFYYLLTGQVPFPGGEALEKLYKHGFEEPKPVDQLRREVPRSVSAVVRKLMAKRPADRFQTPAALVAALAKTATESGGLMPTVASRAARGCASDDTLLTGAASDASQQRGRRRWLWYTCGGGVLLFALATLALIPLLRSDREGGNAGAQTAAGVLENQLGMRFQPIPAGTFLMGSPPAEIERVVRLKLPWTADEDIRAEGPQQLKEIRQPFWMGTSTVTRGQFRQFVKESRYQIPQGASRHWPNNSWAADSKAGWDNPGFEQTDNHPVVCVNWVDAMEFVKWLNNKHPLAPPGAPPGEQWHYALPTEAQWEYACRAGTTTRWFCGDSDECLQGFANVADVSVKRALPSTDWARAAVAWDDGYPFTSPVGAFKPNAWGLHDMHGNVWQWCADAFDAQYYRASPRQDPPGPTPNGIYVLRGGSWSNAPGRCRSAARDHNGSALRRDHYGFRVVLVRVGPPTTLRVYFRLPEVRGQYGFSGVQGEALLFGSP